MTPENSSLASSPSIAQESVSTALEMVLQQVADLKDEMLVHQQESDVLGQHTDENLAKIRAVLGN